MGGAFSSKYSDEQRAAVVAAFVDGGSTAPEIVDLASAGSLEHDGKQLAAFEMPARTMRVVDAKTDAGVRVVDLRPALVDALVEMRARSGGAPDALVFGTATGRKHSASNIRTRLLAKAVERADARLATLDHPPLPEPMTPHSLRRTFASVLLSLGEEVPYVMEQLGHTDPKVTLGIYARVMRRSEGDRERLRALVDGETYEGSPLPSNSLSAIGSS